MLYKTNAIKIIDDMIHFDKNEPLGGDTYNVYVEKGKISVFVGTLMHDLNYYGDDQASLYNPNFQDTDGKPKGWFFGKYMQEAKVHLREDLKHYWYLDLMSQDLIRKHKTEAGRPVYLNHWVYADTERKVEKFNLDDPNSPVYDNHSGIEQIEEKGEKLKCC